ncbi:MAG: DUF3597 family protein [Syntrophomonadales bacterium]
MAYTGTSIVDYLKSIGQDSSYSARSALASQYGITNYTGSADQNLALLNKLKNNSGSIPTITQPKTLETSNTAQTSTNDLLTNALAELQKRLTTNITPKTTSDIKDTPIIPEQSLDIKSPALTTTTADSINSMIQKEQEALAAKQASAQKTLSDAGLLGTGNTLQEQLLTGYQANVPVSQYQTKLAEAQNRYGVIEALDEYKLQGEKVAQAKAAIENLDLQRQAELDAALNRQASMNSISAEQQRINQKYDSQRAKLVGDYNIEAAILATKSNNLTEANKLVSQAVDAYTSDITAEINRFNNFYSIASDFVSSLSSEEKSVLDDVKTQLINKEREEKERLANVLNLKLEYPSAGIEPTDTLEQAVIKAAKIKETEVSADVQKLRMQYVNAGILETDTEEQAINKVIKYLQENPESTARLKYITDDLGNVRVYDESSGTPVLINILEGAGQGNPQVNIAKNYTDGTYMNVKGEDDKVSYEGYYDMLNTFKQMGGGNINTFYSLYPMSDYMDEGNIAKWKSFAHSNKIDESEDVFSLPLTRPE